MDLNFLSIIGLSELEAGLSASVRKPRMNRPKPKDNIIKERIQPPASRVLQRLEKYEVKDKIAPIKNMTEVVDTVQLTEQLWLHRP